jgi:hypothetical protein
MTVSLLNSQSICELAVMMAEFSVGLTVQTIIDKSRGQPKYAVRIL